MNNKKINAVLLSAPSKHGKDLFFALLNELYPNEFTDYSFALSLKEHLYDLIWKEFKIDIVNAKGEEKELVRSIMISFGETWRKIDPLHWVKIVDSDTEYNSFHRVFRTAIIKDARYYNECEFFKNKYKNSCIVVKLRRIGGPEPTNAEKLSLPAIEPLVDYSIEWPTVENTELLKPFIRDFYNKYF